MNILQLIFVCLLGALFAFLGGKYKAEKEFKYIENLILENLSETVAISQVRLIPKVIESSPKRIDRDDLLLALFDLVIVKELVEVTQIGEYEMYTLAPKQ